MSDITDGDFYHLQERYRTLSGTGAYAYCTDEDGLVEFTNLKDALRETTRMCERSGGTMTISSPNGFKIFLVDRSGIRDVHYFKRSVI